MNSNCPKMKLILYIPQKDLKIVLSSKCLK